MIEAIVVDPTAPHTVESLAAIARFSPFHFHRFSRVPTGEGVAATVRRVRLSQAAHRLIELQSVTETALEAGYETSQSFTRAFRDLSGLSPSGFQAGQHVLAAASPAVTLVKGRPMTVFGRCHDGPVTTIPHLHRHLRRWAEGRDVAWEVITRIGIGTGDPEQADGFRYWAGLVLPNGLSEGNGLDRYEAPGGLYASHRLVGGPILIAPTFQTLFGGWLPQSGFEPDDRPVLELYRNGPTEAGTGPLAVDLMIPIREVAR